MDESNVPSPAGDLGDPPPGTLGELIESWGNVVLGLTQLDDQAEAWATLQELKGKISLIESLLAPKMHANIPERPGWVDTAAGIYKRTKRGEKWSWDEEEAAKRVIAHAKENRRFHASTGEVETEGDSVARHLKEAAAFSFRVTPLKSWGITYSDLRERQEGTDWVAPA
jgi:hypothetical protein